MSIPRIVGVAGSLRIGSYNRRLLEAATEELRDADWTIARLRAIPPYDADIEARGLPPAVALFKDQVSDCDAVVIATPEYNRSVPGLLKNAIDWLSRPAHRSPLVGKPVVLMGASPGRGGAGKALEHLRSVLEAIDADVLPATLSVARVKSRFTESGPDDSLRAEIREVVSQVRVPVAA